MTDAYIAFGKLVPDVVSHYGTDADQRVEERRAKLYRETLNKNMEETPLTKIVMSNLGKAKQNPEFKWGMESRDDRYVEVTAAGAYKDSNNTPGAAVGATEQLQEDDYVWLKMPLDSARQIITYEEVLLTLLSDDDSDPDHGATLQGQVAARTLNGATSYIKVALYEDDLGGGGLNGNILGVFNGNANARLIVSPISPAMPEGSSLPWTRYREATEKTNYIQTIMAGLGLTGEELSNAQVFDEDTYKRYWRQVWDQFNCYIERAILFGTRRKANVDVNLTGEIQTLSQYRTGGLYWMFKHADFGNSRNIFDIRKTGVFEGYDFTGKEWSEAGWDFFKLMMLKLSKKSGRTKKMYTSATAKQEIINFFESMSHVNVDTKHKDAWGFEVTRIDGLNCSLEISQHADFSCNPALERSAIVIEPDLISACHKKGRGLAVIRSVKELKSKQVVESGFGWRDAIQEGIFTTLGLEVDNLDAMCWIKNLGCDFIPS